MTTTNTIRTRPLLIAATIPSLLSLAWTAWSVADMIPAPAPIAIAAGIALDVMLVAAVAIAWMAPTIARGAQIASWVIAGVAAAAIAIHSWHLSPALVLMAAVPLIAKALWGLALSAKTAQEEEAARVAAQEAKATEEKRVEAERKAARLSTGLTEDQEAELAELERETAYVESKSERELALAAARARVEQEERLAEIHRDAETQMATDEARAQIHVKRAELADQIRLASPVYTVTEIGPGAQVPNDLSGITGPEGPTGAVAGFGFPQSPPRPGQGGAHPAAQHMPSMPTPGEGALSEAERNRRAVLAAFEQLSTGGTAPTISAVAEAAGVSRRTVNRNLPK